MPNIIFGLSTSQPNDGLCCACSEHKEFVVFFVYMCTNTNIDGFSSLLQIVCEASYERLIEQGIIYIHNFIVLGLAMHLFGAM